MSTDKPSASSLALLALATAAETAKADEPEAQLPRLLRYALAQEERQPMLHERLLREILHVAPDVRALAEAWLDAPATYTVALATALEAQSVHDDAPTVLALAACARFLGLDDNYAVTEEHRKVAAALAATLDAARHKLRMETRVRLDRIVVGWSLLAAAIEACAIGPASEAARYLARGWVDRIVASAVDTERREHARVVEALKAQKEEPERDDRDEAGDEPGFVRVCDLSEHEAKAKKVTDLIGPYKHVVGVGVPLARTPDLALVRARLVFEFPYAQQVIDAILEDLLGREFLRLRPFLIVGAPGGGKSRLVRRLTELLGAGSWRVDGSASDGAAVGGTARRWSTVEPCHPFLAIAKNRFANVCVIVEEVDKAATRKDYGTLWDALLLLLEPETAGRYPDPALQTTLDLSHVGYLATANGVEPLPRPLRDRFRILAFPTPTSGDLHALLPSLAEAYAVERGLEPRWIEPFSAEETDAIAACWPGGSVRRLQRLVEGVLRARDKAAAWH